MRRRQLRGRYALRIVGCARPVDRIYNPNIDISKETTTLREYDRDVFLFLVDDLNPIQA